MSKTVAKIIPAYQPAAGITSARLEALRASEWIVRVGTRTPAGWVVPVPFEFRRDFIADTFTYRIG